MSLSKMVYRAALLSGITFLSTYGSVVSATEKPDIKFAPGAAKATVKGEIQGMDRDTYRLTAKAGQTMRVVIKNRLKLALFHIQMPGAAGKYLPKAGQDDDATEWQGVLPESGTYTIMVGAMRGNDSRYSLDVQITDPK